MKPITHPDPFENCELCAEDPEVHGAWHREQIEKSTAASDRFAARRAELGIPMTQKAPGERF